MAPNKKKPAMTMADMCKMFGGNPTSGALPTRSEGKEEQRRGYGDRNRRDDDEFGGGGWRNEGGKGGGKNDRDGGFGDRNRRDDDRGGGRSGGGGGGGGEDWKAMLSGRGGAPSGGRAPQVAADTTRGNFGAGVRAKLRGDTGNEPVSTYKPPARSGGARAAPPKKEEKAKKPIYEAQKVEEPQGPVPDEELLDDFRAELMEMWDRQNFSSLDDLPELTEAEFESGMACKIVAQTLLGRARGKQPETISKLLTAAKPIFEWLWENDTRRRVKVEFLFDLQEAVSQQKCPRLSPEWALIEAVFDGLYFNEILAEPYFFLWADDTKDQRDGKIEVMFQANTWLKWLKEARLEGEETSDESDGEDGSSDDESEEEDIEALVPQSRKLMTVARP